MYILSYSVINYSLLLNEDTKFSIENINYPISSVYNKLASIKFIYAKTLLIKALEPSISNKSKITSDRLL